MKKLIVVLLGILFVLLGIILFNTITVQSVQQEITPCKSTVNKQKLAEKLSSAIKIPTISSEENDSLKKLRHSSFHLLLDSLFPKVKTNLKKEIINESSLLYIWQGKNPTVDPIILTAHMDVVPVDENTAEQWEQPAFAGVIADGFVWGRGAQDDKVAVISILEAVETLIEDSFIPEKTIMLAFGADEEVGGKEGAFKIAEYLAQKKIRAEFVLDEGLVITDGIVPGMKKPVALVGTSEKGYMSVKISVDMDGGHSSMPGKENAITVLSAHIKKIQDNPFTARIPEPLKEFINHLTAEMPFFNKMAFANLSLFESIIVAQLEKTPSGNASVRTTSAITMFNSGVKDNVLPSHAEAVVNFRILPGDNCQFILEHLKKLLNDDRVTIEVLGEKTEPSPVSPTNTSTFINLESTIRSVFPETVVAPSLMIGGTDGKHYTSITKNVYRFLPVTMNAEDLKRVHGINERISIDNLAKASIFYRELIVNVQKN